MQARALNQALEFITRGGRISLLGIFPEPVAVDLSDMVIQTRHPPVRDLWAPHL